MIDFSKELQENILEQIKATQILQSEAFKRGYEQGFKAGKNLHDGNCVKLIATENNVDEIRDRADELKYIREEDEKYRYTPQDSDIYDQDESANEGEYLAEQGAKVGGEFKTEIL